MNLKMPVKLEGENCSIDIDQQCFLSLDLRRYRQEAYLYDNKIFLFGGGGLTGISYSLENVGLRHSMTGYSVISIVSVL